MPQVHSTKYRGLTLIELMVAVAILAVLAGIASVAYSGYIKAAKVSTAIQQIHMISLAIDNYHSDNQQYPNSLADVGMSNFLDPWGHPYQYLNISTTSNHGKVRKDHNLVPLNTDYDLYSSGPDGQSASPLTASSSRDDIVRANNGGYVGEASNY